MAVLTEEMGLDNDNVEEFIRSQVYWFVVRNSNKYGKKYICAKLLDNQANSTKDMQREPKINKTKLDYACPANITVKKGDAISIPWRRQLQNNEWYIHVKILIAEKLRLGDEKSKILAQVRNEKPRFLITMKDISNIIASYEIDESQKNVRI